MLYIRAVIFSPPAHKLFVRDTASVNGFIFIDFNAL